MRVGRPLLKLPIRFCGETLAREMSALPAEAWIEHPQKYDGNIAVPLISPHGEIGHEAFGPMGFRGLPGFLVRYGHDLGSERTHSVELGLRRSLDRDDR